MQPFITVVVPVRNEASFITKTLGQLVSQEYPQDRYEIIVADGMSDDGTRDLVLTMAAQHPQIRLLDNLKRLSGAGRNVGFQNGRGDYFLVIDGHCFIPGKHLLQSVADCFRESGADCLGRPQPLDPPGLTPFQQAVALVRASRLGHGGDSLIYGDYEGYASPVSNGAAYSREVFDRVGYVDESFDAAEDVEFNYRIEKADLRSFTSPRLTVRYYPRSTLPSLFRQMIRYGRGRYRFLMKHREALTVNQLIPSAFVIGLLVVSGLGVAAAAGSSFVMNLLFLAAGLLYALYAMIILWESSRLAARVNGTFSYLPLIFAAVHVGIGSGFLLESVVKHVPAAWWNSGSLSNEEKASTITR